MKLLIVSQYFSPENFRINDLAVCLVERGHTVTVLTGTPNYPDGNFFHGYGIFKKTISNYHGVEVKRVPLVPRGKGSGVQLALNYVTFALFASIMGPFLCRGEYDLIFVCQLSPVTVGIPALMLKKIKKIPIIFWVLDLWPESVTAAGAINSPKVHWALAKLVLYIYNRCDKIIVASNGFIASILNKGVALGKTGYLPNWYEPEYNKKAQISADPASLGLPNGFVIMFAGAIGVAQDFESILSVAEKLKSFHDIHWVILGDGRKFEWVMEQIEIRCLSDNFHLLGRRESHAMATYFSCADVMLVTLKKDPVFALTVPGKIQSYLACGRPIIAALDGEGGRVVVESGAGLSSRSEDVDGLTESVLTMYRMSKIDREKMGMRGKEYCETNYEREKLIDRLEKWMRELA